MLAIERLLNQAWAKGLLSQRFEHRLGRSPSAAQLQLLVEAFQRSLNDQPKDVPSDPRAFAVDLQSRLVAFLELLDQFDLWIPWRRGNGSTFDIPTKDELIALGNAYAGHGDTARSLVLWRAQDRAPMRARLLDTLISELLDAMDKARQSGGPMREVTRKRFVEQRTRLLLSEGGRAEWNAAIDSFREMFKALQRDPRLDAAANLAAIHIRDREQRSDAT